MADIWTPVRVLAEIKITFILFRNAEVRSLVRLNRNSNTSNTIIYLKVAMIVEKMCCLSLSVIKDRSSSYLSYLIKIRYCVFRRKSTKTRKQIIL